MAIERTTHYFDTIAGWCRLKLTIANGEVHTRSGATEVQGQAGRTGHNTCELRAGKEGSGEGFALIRFDVHVLPAFDIGIVGDIHRVIAIVIKLQSNLIESTLTAAGQEALDV